jgi:hypothetical protein
MDEKTALVVISVTLCLTVLTLALDWYRTTRRR